MLGRRGQPYTFDIWAGGHDVKVHLGIITLGGDYRCTCQVVILVINLGSTPLYSEHGVSLYDTVTCTQKTCPTTDVVGK